MSTKVNKVIVFAIPRFGDMFESFYATQLLKGVSTIIERSRYDLLLHIYDRENANEIFDSKFSNPDAVDGFVFADIDQNDELLMKIKKSKIPCVVLNNIFEDSEVNYVGIDNKASATEIVEYLIQLGHKRIATITGDLATQSGKMRLQGYKEALSKHKIEIKDEYIVEGDYKREKSREAAKKLFKERPRPTAIFAACDLMAFQVMTIAIENDIKIPEELSVVGFDDSPFATLSYISITTISQPLFDMGKIGTEALINIIEKKVTPPFRSILPTALLLGTSCKAIK